MCGVIDELTAQAVSAMAPYSSGALVMRQRNVCASRASQATNAS